MRYLSHEPMVFGQYNPRPKDQRIAGGKPRRIPKKFQCSSGNHDRRLTECYCHYWK